MAEHAAHCALVLYAGMRTLKPVECDCDVDDDQVEPSEADWAAAEAKARAERDKPGQATASLTGPAAEALNDYRALVQELRMVEAKCKTALARLTEELAR